MEKKILLEREREETKARSEHKLSLFFSHLFPSVKKTSTLNQLSFLGKTTVLRHLLQNSSHLRIGCVVNDVADVNIDAKLVRNDRSRQRNKNNGNDGEEKEETEKRTTRRPTSRTRSSSPTAARAARSRTSCSGRLSSC